MPAALLGAALVAGLLAGYNPIFAIAAVLGCAFVILVVNDLTVGMCLMALLSSLDGIPALSGGMLSAPKLAGLLLAVSWLAVLTTRREPTILDERPWVVVTLVLFIAWQLITWTWSEDRGQNIDSLIRYVPNLLIVAIAFSAIRTRTQLMWVVLSLLAGLVVSAVVTTLTVDPEEADRAAGLSGGANEMAAAMVVGIVLCLTLALMRRNGGLLRLTLVGGIGLCTLALFLSLSRGGLLALGAALVVAVLMAGRWRRLIVVTAGVVVLVAVGYFTTFAPLPARERVLEVGNGTGRTDVWTVGMRMVAAQPFTGVGAGNFEIASIHYLLRPGVIADDEFIISVPKIAHNSFLEPLAETGIPGLALFLAILATALRSMYLAARNFERHGERDFELLCRGLFVATVGYLVAAFFITANYQKLLWMLVALGPVVYAVSLRPALSSSSR
jgi:O-antigen ligase